MKTAQEVRVGNVIIVDGLGKIFFFKRENVKT